MPDNTTPTPPRRWKTIAVQPYQTGGLSQHPGADPFFDPQGILVIDLKRSDGSSVELDCALHDNLVILGRDFLESDRDVLDLAPYQAASHGVSRRHAQIELRHENLLYLSDLGSTNGTYLNGQRLQPYQARLLRHGDEVVMGLLQMQVFFAPDRELRLFGQDTTRPSLRAYP